MSCLAAMVLPASGSASTKWWQQTGTNPLHPSGEAARPLSVSKELQLGRQHADWSCRYRVFSRFLPATSGVNKTRPGRVLKPAKSPITEGLEGSVYTLKNELSISF